MPPTILGAPDHPSLAEALNLRKELIISLEALLEQMNMPGLYGAGEADLDDFKRCTREAIRALKSLVGIIGKISP